MDSVIFGCFRLYKRSKGGLYVYDIYLYMEKVWVLSYIVLSVCFVLLFIGCENIVKIFSFFEF